MEPLYCEMNGFTINPDLWFLDAFAYEKFGGTDDFDWLANWGTSTQESFVLNEMEDLQAIYEDYMNNKKMEWVNVPMFVTAHDCYDMVYRAA